MIKKYSSLIAAFITLSVAYTESAQAQIVGTEAYIKGNYVELGIAGAGGYEGANMITYPAPAGMHGRSGGANYFGFVANPQMDGWVNYNGDYFAPGSPENGWGFEVGAASAIAGSNNCAGTVNMLGSITSYSYSAPYYSVDWEGDATSGTDLHFKINYLVNENDLFYTTTVWVTNNSADTIPDLYFYRNVDPDNNEVISSDFSTQNTIVDQAPAYGGSALPIVSAAQYGTYPAYFAFIGDTTFKAGYGGFSNRDGANMFNGVGFTQTIGSTAFSDEAIYLASDIQGLLPADTSTNSHRALIASNTRTFRFLTSFDSTSLSCAIRTMHVTQAGYANVNSTAAAFALTGGSPAGGTYSGTGVSGNMFDPMASGAGTFDIIYSYTDSTGCTGAAVSQIHVVDVTTGVAANTINAHVSVYPNPFTDETTISVGNSIKLDNASVHIYDVTGSEVKVIVAASNNITIDRKGLANGIYFYRLINNNQQIASGKMMIR